MIFSKLHSWWHHRFGKLWDDQKNKNLNMLRMEHDFSMKQKKSEPVPQMTNF